LWLCGWLGDGEGVGVGLGMGGCNCCEFSRGSLLFKAG